MLTEVSLIDLLTPSTLALTSVVEPLIDLFIFSTLAFTSADLDVIDLFTDSEDALTDFPIDSLDAFAVVEIDLSTCSTCFATLDEDLEICSVVSLCSVSTLVWIFLDSFVNLEPVSLIFLDTFVSAVSTDLLILDTLASELVTFLLISADSFEILFLTSLVSLDIVLETFPLCSEIFLCTSDVDLFTDFDNFSDSVLTLVWTPDTLFVISPSVLIDFLISFVTSAADLLTTFAVSSVDFAVSLIDFSTLDAWSKLDLARLLTSPEILSVAFAEIDFSVLIILDEVSLLIFLSLEFISVEIPGIFLDILLILSLIPRFLIPDKNFDKIPSLPTKNADIDFKIPPIFEIILDEPRLIDFEIDLSIDDSLLNNPDLPNNEFLIKLVTVLNLEPSIDGNLPTDVTTVFNVFEILDNADPVNFLKSLNLPEISGILNLLNKSLILVNDFDPKFLTDFKISGIFLIALIGDLKIDLIAFPILSNLNILRIALNPLLTSDASFLTTPATTPVNPLNKNLPRVNNNPPPNKPLNPPSKLDNPPNILLSKLLCFFSDLEPNSFFLRTDNIESSVLDSCIFLLSIILLCLFSRICCLNDSCDAAVILLNPAFNVDLILSKPDLLTVVILVLGVSVSLGALGNDNLGKDTAPPILPTEGNLGIKLCVLISGVLISFVFSVLATDVVVSFLENGLIDLILDAAAFINEFDLIFDANLFTVAFDLILDFTELIADLALVFATLNFSLTFVINLVNIFSFLGIKCLTSLFTFLSIDFK